MVDTDAREYLSEKIDEFLHGKISNNEYVESIFAYLYERADRDRTEPTGVRCSMLTDDPVIWDAFYWTSGHCLDLDERTFSLDASAPILQEWPRVKAFLESDCEYTWPESFADVMTKRWGFLWITANLFTLGQFGKPFERKYYEGFDEQYWPFANAEQWREYNGRS